MEIRTQITTAALSGSKICESGKDLHEFTPYPMINFVSHRKVSVELRCSSGKCVDRGTLSSRRSSILLLLVPSSSPSEFQAIGQVLIELWVPKPQIKPLPRPRAYVGVTGPPFNLEASIVVIWGEENRLGGAWEPPSLSHCSKKLLQAAVWNFGGDTPASDSAPYCISSDFPSYTLASRKVALPTYWE